MVPSGVAAEEIPLLFSLETNIRKTSRRENILTATSQNTVKILVLVTAIESLQ